MTKKLKKQCLKIPYSWDYIRRCNNTDKCLSFSAQKILCLAIDQIQKYGQAVLTHDELNQLTGKKHHQNCNLIKQLGFILDFKFERSILINKKRYINCYVFTKNENTDEILENPRHYFKCRFGRYSISELIYEEYRRDLRSALEYEKKYFKKQNRRAFEYLYLLESKQFAFPPDKSGFTSSEVTTFLEYIKLRIKKLNPELHYKIEVKQRLQLEISMEEIERGEVEWVQA